MVKLLKTLIIFFKLIYIALKHLDKTVLPFSSSYLQNSTVHCRTSVKIDVYSTVAMVVTGLLIFLVIIGTIIDVRQRHSLKNPIIELNKTEIEGSSTKFNLEDKTIIQVKTSGVVKFLEAFSAYKNTLLIFKIDERRKFSCLNPLRFLAFLW